MQTSLNTRANFKSAALNGKSFADRDQVSFALLLFYLTFHLRVSFQWVTMSVVDSFSVVSKTIKFNSKHCHSNLMFNSQAFKNVLHNGGGGSGDIRQKPETKTKQREKERKKEIL